MNLEWLHATPEQPNKSKYAPRNAGKDLENYEAVIRALRGAKTTADGIVVHLKSVYGLEVTKGQLQKRLKKWGLVESLDTLPKAQNLADLQNAEPRSPTRTFPNFEEPTFEEDQVRLNHIREDNVIADFGEPADDERSTTDGCSPEIVDWPSERLSDMNLDSESFQDAAQTYVDTAVVSSQNIDNENRSSFQFNDVKDYPLSACDVPSWSDAVRNLHSTTTQSTQLHDRAGAFTFTAQRLQLDHCNPESVYSSGSSDYRNFKALASCVRERQRQDLASVGTQFQGSSLLR